MPESHQNFSSARIDKETALLKNITLAVSATWRHGNRRLDWIENQGFACSFAPNPVQPGGFKDQLMPYIHRGMGVRHHAYFPGNEFGHADSHHAEKAVKLHFNAMSAVQGAGINLMTVHVGLDQTHPVDHQRVTENLTRLVEYGKKNGIIVSLENLRYGPTSNPYILLEWARRSGSGITLDIGHANSSRCVRRKEISVPKIIDLVADQLMEVHLYESETDCHRPPKTMDILGPIVDKLVTTGCRWWTIELDDEQDVLKTRKLLAEHFDKDKKTESKPKA